MTDFCLITYAQIYDKKAGFHTVGIKKFHPPAFFFASCRELRNFALLTIPIHIL